MVVTVLGMMLALIRILPEYTIGITILLAAIIAHIAGAAIGTQLRRNGSAVDPEEDQLTGRTRHRSFHRDRCDFAPATQLRDRTSLGSRISVVTLCGAGAGALLGGPALAWINWSQINLANLALAMTACALLGGLASFLASSFCEVLWNAFSQARSSH